MKQLHKILVISLSTLLFLSSCGEDKAIGTSTVINMIETEDIPTLDISSATDPISFNSLGNVMEGLVMQGRQAGEIVNGVASEYSFDEATLTWTFHINPDSVWVNYNGETQRNVTAHDFVYAWDRIINGEAYQYGFILTDVAKIIEYKAVDDSTLQLTLSEDIPYFLSVMTFPSTYPLPFEMIEESKESYGTTAESLWYNGPYYMSEWTHGSQFIWTKNDAYWEADVVKTPAIVWRIIESYETATAVELYDAGEIDRVQLSGEFVSDRKDNTDLVTTPDTAVYYLMFNIANSGIKNGSPDIDETFGNPLFDNLKIRQAIAYQIEKSYITDMILNDGSLPAYSFIPVNYLAYNGNPYESIRNEGYMLTNQDLAKELFAQGMSELGYEPGDNHLTIDIINYETDSAKLIIEYIRQSLDELFIDYGITITITPLPLAQKLIIYQSGDFDLTLSRWLPDYDWPTTYLDKWLSDNAHNLIGYSNPDYDNLVSPIGKTTEEAFNDLQKAEAILLNDAAIVPLYQAAGTYLQNPDVKDIYFYLSGYKSSYKWAYKESSK